MQKLSKKTQTNLSMLIKDLIDTNRIIQMYLIEQEHEEADWWRGKADLIKEKLYNQYGIDV
jgi:hypothetical protein